MPAISIMIKPVSGACNMRCRYCFYSDVTKHRSKENMGKMSIATLETLVRRVLRYAEGTASFAFQGGEPTLAGTEFFEQLVAFQKTYAKPGTCVTNAVQTNGYYLPEDMLELFAREHFLVGVSLDGTPELHDRLRVDAAGEGTSARVEATIRRLQEKNIEFNILTVVNGYVAAEPEKVFQSLMQYGHLQYIPCLDDLDGTTHPWSLSAEQYGSFLCRSFDMYYSAWKAGSFISIRNFDNWVGMLKGMEPENCAMCGRCARYWLVEADGSVYPCDFYVLDEWCLGNVNEQSFFRLEKSGVQNHFLQLSLQKPEACASCRWYGLCRGGCRRDREPFTDGVPGANRYCSAYQSFFGYAYPRLREMAEKL